VKKIDLEILTDLHVSRSPEYEENVSGIRLPFCLPVCVAVNKQRACAQTVGRILFVFGICECVRPVNKVSSEWAPHNKITIFFLNGYHDVECVLEIYVRV
jgi:hypothetical protein